MTILIILTSLGLLALIAAIFNKKKKKSIEELTSKLTFIQQDDTTFEKELSQIVKRTFLYAKGAHLEIPLTYTKKNAESKEFLLDWIFSKSGNKKISQQRVVLLFSHEIDQLSPFVIETYDPLSKIKGKDLEEVGFQQIKTYSSRTYLKAKDPSDIVATLGADVQKLFKKYPNLCIENHGGYFFAYQNDSNHPANRLIDFYKDVKASLLKNSKY